MAHSINIYVIELIEILVWFFIYLQKLQNLVLLSRIEPTKDKNVPFLVLEIVIPQYITLAFYLTKNGWLFYTLHTGRPIFEFIWMTSLEAADFRFF